MIEIRIHGRGGQGNVVAAYILATAAIEQGYHAQAFPSFGAERRGAPVIAFVRIAREPVRRRCQVLHPQFLIVQDRALLHVPGVISGLDDDGGILVNTRHDASGLCSETGRDVITLPAAGLAVKHIGRPVPNTALLAAFVTLTGIIELAALESALSQRFAGKGEKLLQGNLALVREAATAVPPRRWVREDHAPDA